MPEKNGERLDRWLACQPELDLSRARVQKLIKAGNIEIGSQIIKKSQHQVHEGEIYVVSIPPAEPIRLEPVDLNLRVLYEDEHLALIHKPAGLATHPGPGDSQISIAHGILFQWPAQMQAMQGDTANSNATHPDTAASPADQNAEDRGPYELRPGIVHRLDRDTEGLLLIALHDRARTKLMALFEKRQIEKEYRAWLVGSLPSPRGRVELAIGRHPVHRTRMRIHPQGRMAITEYEQLEMIPSSHGRRFFKVALKILTGRTHQIRVHMAHLGASVVGDVLYSRSAAKYKKFGMLLLASRLAFQHPFSGEKLDFSLPDPDRFLEFQKKAASL